MLHITTRQVNVNAFEKQLPRAPVFAAAYTHQHTPTNKTNSFFRGLKPAPKSTP